MECARRGNPSGVFIRGRKILPIVRVSASGSNGEKGVCAMKRNVKIRSFGLALVTVLVLGSLLQLSACAKNTTTTSSDDSQTTLSNFNLNCGSSSCVN